MSKYDEIPPCEVCGTPFDNVFEMADHMMEDDGHNHEFDPCLILPGGYQLRVGSLMRLLHHHANNPEKIRFITQDVYATLFAAEQSEDEMREMIEDTIVEVRMENFDEKLIQFLDEMGGNNGRGIRK